MSMFYSPSTGGFYDQGIHGALPGDIVGITDAAYAALMEAQAQGANIENDDSGNPVAVMPAPPSLAETKATLCALIESAVSAAYAAIGSDSPGRIAEYQQAKDDATAFKAAGYAGTAPATVACWAQAKSWTEQQACDDILATAAAWGQALVAIRTARLIGKANVGSAADAAAAQTAANAAIANVNAVLAEL